jgi:hypothetical protein
MSARNRSVGALPRLGPINRNSETTLPCLAWPVELMPDSGVMTRLVRNSPVTFVLGIRETTRTRAPALKSLIKLNIVADTGSTDLVRY